MASIEQILLPPVEGTAGLWAQVAQQVSSWLRGRSLPARDAVLLLPFAALLAPAREAFAALGGWQPRIETTLTLAASLGPPPAPEPGQCSGETTLDTLSASLLLRQQPWGADWQRRDGPGFAHIVALVVAAAQQMREAALARAPALRAAFWDQARTLAAAPSGPAAVEALLLRVAIEWAAQGSTAATDRLFELRPSAWIALRLGGADALAEGLLGHDGLPSLRLDGDPPLDDPLALQAPSLQMPLRVSQYLCDDFEAEAQAAAALVIDALNAGRAPVALVALDRELVRRVRALLERAQVPLIDETGWRLATTRAAAGVVALLRAALPGAGPDAALDWLKTWPPPEPRALDALEAQWRERRHVGDAAAAQRLWAMAQQHLQPLSAPGPRSLAAWLALLHERLQGDGSLKRLADDAAGAQVLAALGWSAPQAWQAAAAEWRGELPAFVAWVEQTLEAAPYLPLPDAGAQVVLTPLARAFGRPFRQVVVPGADAKHLGSGAPPPSLLGEAFAEALGLDHSAARRQRQRLNLIQLLHADGTNLLRRRRDGDEPLADSPDVEWLRLAAARQGQPLAAPQAWLPRLQTTPAAPVKHPLPTAATVLPAALSASQLEALRQCPYRFFARAVLRLDEPDELEAGLAKRDYGNWLHAVLHQFHSTREPLLDDLTQLQAAADAITLEQGLDAGELLPFRASFDHFAPAYLAWLARREDQGWTWQGGETDHLLPLDDTVPGLKLRGRIDRLDTGPANARQLIDYKTGSATALKQRVAQPLEDTQLAFYAALLGADADLGAAYLALDDADAPLEIVHPRVHDTAAVLLQGLAGEWQRLRQGAALPALGEGRVCDTCEARGLCRRDDWAPLEP